MSGGAPGGGVPDRGDARKALSFLVGKFILFAVLPVAVAAVIVFFTLPP